MEIGTHVITAAKDGYQLFSDQLVVTQGASTFNFEMIPKELEENEVLLSGTVTHTKQDPDATGWWKVFNNDPAIFTLEILFEENINGTVMSRHITDYQGGRTGRSGESTYSGAIEMRELTEDTQNRIYVFVVADNYGFAAAILPDNETNWQIWRDIFDIPSSEIIHYIQQVIDESEDVIYGQTKYGD